MQQLGLPIEDSFQAALAGAERPGPALFAAPDQLGAPVYVADADGTVVHANPACARFAGRQPRPGSDRWCVTWKLYTDDGERLPHDACPMADAIRTRQPIRGVTAIAERPDGTRRRFLPYPVPLFDRTGELTGAVNMLLDISNGRQAEWLRDEGRRCRRLAIEVSDREVSEALFAMAAEYDAKAAKLDLPI